MVLALPVESRASDAASVEAAAWFAGEWAVGPAPVEGMDTIIVAPAKKSVIRHLEGAFIERELTLRGRLHSMRFEVRSFGGNFPWWGDNGGNYVAKRVDDSAFILAPVGPMGKADWEGGWLYQRVEASAESDAAPETAEQP